jgi:lipid II:glycine glycyltransferase (peptidoglycan interpeptide bridge formation enzyme)
MTSDVAVVADVPSADWDALTVDPPGGHVLQSAAWAEQCRGWGWRPRFVRFDDGRAALLLTHGKPLLPGFFAYCPRGPITGGDPPEHVAARAVSLAAWSRAAGATILAVDPELQADAAFEADLAAGGFRITEEIQPSRHRLVLELPGGTDEASLLRAMSKSTRQRIGAAKAGTVSVREDASGGRLADFGALMDATARRKRFDFAADRGFIEWWRRALSAGRTRFLVAETSGQLLGGLIVHLQGGHWATAFSADDAAFRFVHPGTMHLLRWTAIRMALAAGAPSIDLGGVDVAGARRRPEPGEATWGLYEHKAGFGARWIESAGAHEIVLRPAVYRTQGLLRTLRRRLRGLAARS